MSISDILKEQAKLFQAVQEIQPSVAVAVPEDFHLPANISNTTQLVRDGLYREFVQDLVKQERAKAPPFYHQFVSDKRRKSSKRNY